MNFFELGVKLATSRWREAIRSGEVSEPTADLLKQRMGFDPKAWEDRTLFGANKRMLSHGYTSMEPSFRSSTPWNKILSSKEEFAKWLAEKQPAVITTASGGGFTDPLGKRVMTTKRPMLGKGLTLGHEARETTPVKAQHPYLQVDDTSKKFVPKPLLKHMAKKTLIGDPMERISARQALAQSGRVTSQHMSSMLPIEDIREMRMAKTPGTAIRSIPKSMVSLFQSPEAGDVGPLFGMRQMTREAPAIAEASKQITGVPGYLPKKRLGAISKQMTSNNMKRLYQLALGGKPSPIRETMNLFPRGGQATIPGSRLSIIKDLARKLLTRR